MNCSFFCRDELLPFEMMNSPSITEHGSHGGSHEQWKKGPYSCQSWGCLPQHWFHSRRSEKKTSAEAKTDCENSPRFRLKGEKKGRHRSELGRPSWRTTPNLVRFFFSHHSDDSLNVTNLFGDKNRWKGSTLWDLTEEWQSNYWKKKLDFLQ